MRNLPLIAVAASSLLVLVAAPAWAGTIKIGKADFSGSETVVSFDGLAQFEDADNASALVDFDGLFGDTAADGMTSLFANGGTASAANLTEDDPNDDPIISNPFSFSLVGRTATRVGWDAITNSQDQVLVSLFLDGIEVLSSQAFNRTHVGGGLGEFFIGVESQTSAFDEVRVAISATGTGRGSGAHLMNDLRFDLVPLNGGIVAVPLPPAAYMGLGLLAGLAILRRRRSRLSA